MKERLYVNPYRHTKTGAPVMQKTPPRLKSAFADRRKTRIHKRAEFRRVKLLAHVGGVLIMYSGGFFGYSVSALYDPHMNIQFGASYISRFLRSYSSPTIALTAYNAGPGRVASGEYSTAYAEHVLGHQQTILGWLRSRGCSATFNNGPLVPAEVTEEAGE